MKQLMKILLVALLVILVWAGIALANSILWSGTANITIEQPTVTPTPTSTLTPLEVTEVYVGIGSGGQRDGTVVNGVWNFSTADDPTGNGTLYVKVHNPRTTEAIVQSFINGVSTPLNAVEIGIGVTGRAYRSEGTINPGQIMTFTFTINIDTAVASPGTLPGIALELREV